MYKISQLFDISHSLLGEYISSFEYPWEALAGLKSAIVSVGRALGDDYTEVSPDVWIHRDAKVYPSAYIGGPCIIGEGTEVRHCAFIRGSAVIGKNCVIGNSVEIKNAVIFDNTEVPHYNYVGDSILGYKSHLGAGSITSNIKSDRKNIVIHDLDCDIETGLRKIGAMLGDFVEVGSNAVLNPGTVIGRNTTVYPLSSVRGVIPADSIYKKDGVIVDKVRR